MGGGGSICGGDWCMSWCCVLLCVIVTCGGSGSTGIYSRMCCSGSHGG